MAQPEPTEVEVKLGVTRPRVIARLLRSPDPARLAGFRPTGEAHLVRVTDRYLGVADDPEALMRGGIRARLRRKGQRVELTVKRTGVLRGSVTTRAELEAPATRSFDPRRWPPSAARAVLEQATAGRRLVEIACLRQARLTRNFERDGTRVEVSLDALAALDGDGRVAARRHELEAELLDGDERSLDELADALGRLDGVVSPLGSKLLFALESRNGAAPGSGAGPDADPPRS